jgi:hypothetical protein
MPSDQMTANRNNAKKSIGPRTVVGREAARRHARRHGLAVAVDGDPAHFMKTLRRSKALSLSNGTQQVRAHARETTE